MFLQEATTACIEGHTSWNKVCWTRSFWEYCAITNASNTRHNDGAELSLQAFLKVDIINEDAWREYIVEVDAKVVQQKHGVAVSDEDILS